MLSLSHYSKQSSMASSAASFFLLLAFFGAAMSKDLHINWNSVEDFAAWAANTTAVEGDRLYFDYPPNPDTTAVEQVPEELYNSCKDGHDYNDAVMIGDHGADLSDPGMYYFVNPFPNQCNNGWKLQLNVLSNEEAAAQPPPPTPTGPFFPVTPSAPFFPVAPDTPFFPVAPDTPFVTRAPPSPDFIAPPFRSAAALVSLSTLIFPSWLLMFSLFLN